LQTTTAIFTKITNSAKVSLTRSNDYWAGKSAKRISLVQGKNSVPLFFLRERNPLVVIG